MGMIGIGISLTRPRRARASFVAGNVNAVGVATGTSIATGVDISTATSAAASVGAAVGSGFGTAAMLSSVASVGAAGSAVVGAATIASAGASVGQAAGSVVGTGQIPSTATVAGSGAVSANGTSSAASVASSTGASTTTAWPLTYLPTVGVSPSLVIGTKQMISTYSGNCVNVVRASDSTGQDVGFSQGVVDMAAVATFAGASEPTVAKWYNQNGSGNDLTNVTVSTQPRLRTANKMRGVQGITFDYNSSFAGTKFLNIPVAITLNTRDCTVFAVYAPYSSYYDNVPVVIGDVATGAVALQNASQVMRAYLKTGLSGTVAARSSASVIAMRGGSSAATLYVDNHTTTLGVGTAGTTSVAGGIGIANGFGSQNNFCGEYFALVIYPGALSDADVAAVQSALTTMYSISYAQNRQVVCEGDSITAGVKTTFDQATMRQTYELSTKDSHYYNLGLSGTTAQTRYGARVALWSHVNRTDAATKIAVIWLGTNDLAAGTTGSVTYNSYLLPYIQYVQSLGYTVLVPTTIPRQALTAPQEAERITYNGLITGGAATNGYTAIDVTTLTHFQVQADASNSTYYADGIHPTNAGGAILAGYLSTFINEL